VECTGYRKTVYDTEILCNTHTHTISPAHPVIEDTGPSLLSECHKDSRYSRTCSDIYTSAKYIELPAPISQKLQILLRSIMCGFFLNRNPNQIWRANYGSKCIYDSAAFTLPSLTKLKTSKFWEHPLFWAVAKLRENIENEAQFHSDFSVEY
jgi:hypothetical protein